MSTLARHLLHALPALLALAPRAGAAQAPAAAPAPRAAAARPVAARLGPRDLARLRWIAGDWRGVGTAGTRQPPFYERYRFVDDSTLLMHAFADSARRTPTDSTRYVLRAGRLAGTGPGPAMVAVRLDSLGVEFAVVPDGRFGFRWERAPGSGERPTAWQATILATSPDGTVRQRHYQMARLR